MSPLEREIHDWIVGTFGSGEAGTLGVDDPLIELGVLDSLKFFRLVAHLEKAYGLDLKERAADVAAFNSISALARLVREK